MEKIEDIYTDYLISSFGQTSATKLSEATDHLLSHDQITRFLLGANYSSKTVWKRV